MKIKVSGSDFDKIHRVANVIEKYIEFDKLINSLSKEEYDLLIRSLEESLKEEEQIKNGERGMERYRRV